MTRSGSDGHPQIISVAELFTEGTYRIPLYQRAYAWTAAEIETLLTDIRDARLNGTAPGAGQHLQDYYLGSLVVDTRDAEGGRVYEVVDGQQRLTTLFLVLALTDHFEEGERDRFAGRLTFEGRPGAAADLRRIARSGGQARDLLETDGLKHALEVVDHAASRRNPRARQADPAHDVVFTDEDLHYLRHHVKILRTELPSGTDLNHYFEVMNTRGEQLEKHEILKARLISALDPGDESRVFSKVWDACTVLDRHIQTQFDTAAPENGESERCRIFGPTWDKFVPADADDLFRALAAHTAVSEQHDGQENHRPALPHGRLSLSAVLSEHPPSADGVTDRWKEVDEESGSYGAIIDFPNFLLHVLKLQQGETVAWADVGSATANGVRLEDKYLLAEFKCAQPLTTHAGDTREAARQWVRAFAFRLLKTRYLMDTYVIRTQATPAADDEENWVIHRARMYTSGNRRQLSARSTFGSDHRGDERLGGQRVPRQRQILMLQAMFQVTDTRRASKYFLFQILQWLDQRERAEQVDGDEFIEHLTSMAHARLRALKWRSALDQGTHVPNYLFNLLDYELWNLGTEVRSDAADEVKLPLDADVVEELSQMAPYFRFRYRTSVEHFYPTRPSGEQGHRELGREHLDAFGNLCIMSRSENSRRNNLVPLAKANEFNSNDQSLKFQLMATVAKQQRAWEETQIDEHGEAMRKVLAYAAEGSPNTGLQ